MLTGLVIELKTAMVIFRGWRNHAWPEIREMLYETILEACNKHGWSA